VNLQSDAFLRSSEAHKSFTFVVNSLDRMFKSK